MGASLESSNGIDRVTETKRRGTLDDNRGLNLSWGWGAQYAFFHLFTDLPSDQQLLQKEKSGRRKFRIEVKHTISKLLTQLNFPPVIQAHSEDVEKT